MHQSLTTASRLLFLSVVVSCARVPQKQLSVPPVEVTVVAYNQQALTDLLSKKGTQLFVGQINVIPIGGETTKLVLFLPFALKDQVPKFEEELMNIPGTGKISDNVPSIPLLKERKYRGNAQGKRYHFSAVKLSEWKEIIENEECLSRAYFNIKNDCMDFWKETLDPVSGEVVTYEHRSYELKDIIRAGIQTKNELVNIETPKDNISVRFPSALHARSFTAFIKEKLGR